jgi:hypothetical protein
MYFEREEPVISSQLISPVEHRIHCTCLEIFMMSKSAMPVKTTEFMCSTTLSSFSPRSMIMIWILGAHFFKKFSAPSFLDLR